MNNKNRFLNQGIFFYVTLKKFKGIKKIIRV